MPRLSVNLFSGGSRLDILLNALALSAPMLLLSAAFITLILYYQVHLESDSNNYLFPVANATTDPGAYYVRLDSTLLIIAASWTSTLAPLLSGSAIALATYPIAQKLLYQSDTSHHQALPTPFQLSLVLKLIDGATWSGLWNLLLYNEAWTKRADRHATVLASLSAVVLSTAFLSTLVFGADTWLHIATTTHNIQQVIPLSGPLPMYGLMLDSGCTLTNNSFTALNATHGTCALNIDHPSVLANGYPALQVLNNQSDHWSVLTTQQNPGQPLYYLGVAPTARNQDYDFTAKTFALQTTCKPISKACNLQMGVNTTFSCNNETFYVKDNGLNSVSLFTGGFRYPDFNDHGDTYTHNGVDNPFYFGAAQEMPIVQTLPQSLLQDPEVATDATTLSIILTCNITVLDVTYDHVQGEVKRFDTKPSNVSTTNAIVSAITMTSFGMPNMKAQMNVELSVATSAQDLADSFAKSLSTTILSGAAGSVTATSAVAAQQRQELLVTRLPKAPFYLLICTNFCFPILAIVLSILAARTSEDARQIRCRLSVAGVVASRFDTKQARLPVNSAEELFGEFNGKTHVGRIGFNRSISGGFEFQAFREEKLLHPIHDDSDISLRHIESTERRSTLRGSTPGYIC